MRTKVLYAMGSIMLVCLITLGTFALPIGMPLCSSIGLVYGIRYRDRRFVGWCLAGLLVGGGAMLYTWLLIGNM